MQNVGFLMTRLYYYSTFCIVKYDLSQTISNGLQQRSLELGHGNMNLKPQVNNTGAGSVKENAHANMHLFSS